MAQSNKWLPLFSTQFLGVLNDNFLKNVIIFISIFWLAEDQQGIVIPLASALLVLPFVLSSPLAGRMAQIYSKQRIYEYAKLAEIPIMAIAIVGFFMANIWVVMFALLLMGFQSALYAPSKYGLIRDVGGTEGLSYGVGTMELLTFLGVLLGQIAAGLVSDQSQGVAIMVAIILMGLAIAGYFTARQIKVTEEKVEKSPMGSIEPFTFLYKTFRWANGIKGLNTTIMGLGSFWFVAGMIQMNIYEHAPEVYQLSNTGTSIVMALIAIGIGLGCFISGKLSKSRVELGMVPLGGLGLSILLTIFATVELSLYPFVICLFLAALFSGFYKVPLSAWIQERVEGRKLGLALAYNQLVAFLFILVAAGVFGYVANKFNTYAVFAVLAVVSWFMTLITMANIPAMMLRFIAYMITRSYFKIEVTGAEHIPKKSGALLVANHLSLMDAFFMVAAVPRMLRFVVARGIYEFPLFNWLLKRLNMIPISERLDKVKLDEFNTLCREEVNAGHILCIFPEGQISRIGHLLEFKKGIEHIAKGVNVPIIPVQMEGVRGVPLSFEIGSSKPVMPWLKSFRKRISIQIGEPMPASSKSELLRQKVQLLNAISFEKRIRPYHTIPYFMKKSVAQFKDREFQVGQVSSTFKSFYEQAQNIAGFWTRTENNYVGIDLDDHDQLGLIHASCLFAGKTPIFFNPAMAETFKAAIIEEYNLDCVLSATNKDQPYVHPEQLLSTHQKRAVEVHSGEQIGIFYDQDVAGNWLALPMTHVNFLASIRGFMHLFQKPTDARIFSNIPAYTSYGNLNTIWLPYFFGMTVFKPQKDHDLAADWSANGINTLFTDANTIVALNSKLSETDWQQVNYVLVGQQPLPAALKQQLTDQNIFVSESLGITQGGIMLAMNTPDYEVTGVGGGKPMLQSGSKEGSYGRPLPGLGIRIVDGDHVELPISEPGTVEVYGAALCSEHKSEDGWLNTGMQAYTDENGFLFLA